MTTDKGILIKNIYYMLSYAFQVLKPTDYGNFAAEEFEDARDLFAAILAKGISQQIKQGLYREYTAKIEDLPLARGKLDIQGTFKNLMRRKKQLTCEYDELTENNVFNQVLKTTSKILVCDKTVSKTQRAALKKNLLIFDSIDLIDPNQIRWSTLKFHRNNKTYQMLMNLCRFILENLLQTTEDGAYRLTAFTDEHMEKLFEKFILEYYKRHYSDLHPEAAKVKWYDAGSDEKDLRFLPAMQTDIMLHLGEKTLIIDAKYYKEITLSQYEKHKVRSDHLYQVFSYIKNYEAKNGGKVSGMLLYAKTEEVHLPDRCQFFICDNPLCVRVLNLNTDFDGIKNQLNEIAKEVF